MVRGKILVHSESSAAYIDVVEPVNLFVEWVSAELDVVECNRI